MKNEFVRKPGVRHDPRTDQYVPTNNGYDISPTSFDKDRAMELAEQAARPHPMEHVDFTFDLISSKACADAFPTRELAEEFSAGIRESRVHPYQLGADPVTAWVVQVGPWMYAHGIKPRNL